MLHEIVHGLKGDSVLAKDGPVGKVADVYFDDERWAVRYLVVETGEFWPGRKLLISPASVSAQFPEQDSLRVALTRDQFEKAPGTDADPPISRVLEEAHARYYGHAQYWTGPHLWGQVPEPFTAPTPQQEQPVAAQAGELEQKTRQQAERSHLRSANEVVGYAIRAKDGEVGHVEDFRFDTRSWAITDMIVDTRNWLPGKKVRVEPAAIRDIDWDNRAVSVNLSRDELKHALPTA